MLQNLSQAQIDELPTNLRTEAMNIRRRPDPSEFMRQMIHPPGGIREARQHPREMIEEIMAGMGNDRYHGRRI